jgi:cytochrome P450
MPEAHHRSLAEWYRDNGAEVPEDRRPAVMGELSPAEPVWDEAKRAWIVPTYDAVRAINVDEGQWRSVGAPPDDGEMPFGVTRAEYEAFEGPQKIVMLKGEAHDRLHRWWLKAFSERRLAAMRTEIFAPVVDAAIDRFCERGAAELVDDLADRVALPVNFGMMGISPDAEFESRCLTVVSRYHTGRIRLRAGESEAVEEAVQTAREMRDMIMPFVLAARDGGDGVIGDLWRAAPDLFDEPWDANAICDNVFAMFEGGTHSMATAIGGMLYLLTSRPDLQEAVREGGDEVAKAFVEESLRLYGPTVYNPRFAERDVEFCGASIKQNELVLAYAAAANRDPAHYSCPAEVDLGRKGLRDHFTFTVGPRLCPGHGPARVALLEIAGAVVSRLQDLRFDETKEAPRLWTWSTRRGFAPLHVRFTPSVPS